MRHDHIPLTKERLPEACREVEWVRFPRADLQSAPGRLRTPSGRHDDRPARSALDWDRPKMGDTHQVTSQEARLELSGGVRSPMQEPRWNADRRARSAERAPRP
jgi:hypothetical protein